MTVNVDTGEIDKECELNRSYACSGCANYYDKSDTVCKRDCIHYVRKLPCILKKNKILENGKQI